MSNISDLIEQFILDALGEDNVINLSRNELAQYFGCVPSQINYVLATRFPLSRGFIIESQRGGGGYIKIYKLNFHSDDSYLKNLILDLIGEEIDYKQTRFLIENLITNGLISKNEGETVLVCLSDKALANPFKLENKLRANILRQYVIKLLKGGEDNAMWKMRKQ